MELGLGRLSPCQHLLFYTGNESCVPWVPVGILDQAGWVEEAMSRVLCCLPYVPLSLTLPTPGCPLGSHPHLSCTPVLLRVSPGGFSCFDSVDASGSLLLLPPLS